MWTADGLYVRRNDEQVWKEESGELGRKEIFSLVDDKTYLYAAAASEIYRIQKIDAKVQKVYSVGVRVIDDGEKKTKTNRSWKNKSKIWPFLVMAKQICRNRTRNFFYQ